jgi:hypothetical protein
MFDAEEVDAALSLLALRKYYFSNGLRRHFPTKR